MLSRGISNTFSARVLSDCSLPGVLFAGLVMAARSLGQANVARFTANEHPASNSRPPRELISFNHRVDALAHCPQEGCGFDHRQQQWRSSDIRQTLSRQGVAVSVDAGGKSARKIAGVCDITNPGASSGMGWVIPLPGRPLTASERAAVYKRKVVRAAGIIAPPGCTDSHIGHHRRCFSDR